LLIAFITACSTVDDDYLGGKLESPSQLNTGDVIRVVTVDYEDYRFRVTRITEVAIQGEKISVPFKTIRTLEVITPVQIPNERSTATNVTILFVITAAGLLLLNPPFVTIPE